MELARSAGCFVRWSLIGLVGSAFVCSVTLPARAEQIFLEVGRTSTPNEKLREANRLIVDSLPADRAQAEKLLIEVIRDQPKMVDAYATLMRFTLWQIATGSLEPAEFQKAADLAEKVEDLEPNRPLASYLQCELLLSMGQASQANALYRSAAAKWPQHLDTKVFEARYWAEVDPALSLSAAQSALAQGEPLDTLSPAIAMALATTAKNSGRPPSEVLEQFAKVYPDRWIYHKAAVAAGQEGKFTLSQSYFERAVSLGNRLESGLQLGILEYSQLKQPEKAVARFNSIEKELRMKGVEAEDSLTLLLCHKALALFRLGEWPKAEEASRAALELGSDMKSIIVPFSEEVIRLGQGKKLIKGLLRVAELNPGLDYVHLTLGNLNSEEGALEEAFSHYGKAISLQPFRDDLYAARAHVAYRLKNYDRSLRDFGKAAALNEGQATHHYNVACMQSLLGEHEAAAKSLKRAFSLNAELRTSAAKDSDLKAFFESEEASNQLAELGMVEGGDGVARQRDKEEKRGEKSGSDQKTDPRTSRKEE